MLLVNGAQAAAPADASTAPLLEAGLDPFTVYRQMFASTANHAESCWWYFGALPFHVEDVGEVTAFQEETARAHLTEDVGPDTLRLHWQEAGVFREFTTGEIPKGWWNPITGVEEPHLSVLNGAPAQYVLTRHGPGISVSLIADGIDVHSLTVAGAVKGDRVSLTQVETKSRVMGPTGVAPVTLRTVLKIYSSLAELKSGGPSVGSKGFYAVDIPARNSTFVSGMMQKTAMDEKLNPIAWSRVKAASPSFFKGERVAPNWS